MLLVPNVTFLFPRLKTVTRNVTKTTLSSRTAMANTHIQLDDRLSELSRLDRRLQEEIIETKGCRNALAPISRLSVELLSEIFVISTIGEWDPPSQNPHRDHKTQYRRGCIIISQISGSWRAVALGSPEIWARIDIRTTTKNSLLKYMMKNAGPVALSVVIHSGEHSPVSAADPPRIRALNTIKTMLASSPMKSLTFFLSSSMIFYTLIPSFPSRSETIQTLEVNSYWSWDSSTPWPSKKELLPQGAPNLRRLVLLGPVCIPWKSGLFTQSPNLTSLHLNAPTDTTVAKISSALRHNVHLQELKLLLPQDDMKASPAKPNQGTVLLPNLTALHLTGSVANVTTLLSLVQIPVDIAHLVLSVHVPPEFLQSDVTAPPSQVLLAASANARSIGREDHLHNHLIVAPGDSKSPANSV
ncbi:hypothetical protein DFP72DRAFT_160416 [Ephemerocybe angulata]|uniref:F-box domain-containing protein n=1 Tax=Ephemerocybe angulata TaxID=980116 RepID=A0A8H6I4I5_9AGAR|nr:hypothetical protein DFP72DRAFT_160416 [Tulosesus angulatus]